MSRKKSKSKIMNFKNKYFTNWTLLTAIFFFSTASLFAHFGPRSPLGGVVSCAITHNGIVYLGTTEGGVFESTNAQITTWRARPVGLLTGKISALTHSGSYLFAGTVDGGVYIFDGFVGNDRYWNKVNNGLTNLQIKSLVAVDSITILAGTDGGGLFKTTNKGASWTAVNDALISGSVVTGMIKAGSRIILTTLTGGVFASDNDGNSWTDFNDANTLNITGTVALSYNETTDELLVLNNDGLFISATATSATNPVYSSAQTNLPAGTEIRAMSNNGTDWYLATDLGVYTSASSAINWSDINTGFSSTDATAIVALPATIVAAIYKEGIYKTESTSINWALTNLGFNNPVTHTMVALGDTIVVAVTENGVYVSTAIGTAPSYVQSNTGLTDSTNVNDVIFAENILLAATANGGVFLSSNLGATWVAINMGLSNLNIAKLFYANGKLYALSASGNLYASDLNVNNWTALQNGLPGGAMPTSMAFQGNNIILGTLGNGVYIKDHSGTTWSPFNTGLTNLNVTSVTASAGKFYAGTDGDGVFVSDVNTANWSATAQTTIPHTTLMGLDGSKIQAMESYAGYVYAGYKGGLLTTSDEGATWVEAGNQFNLPSFTNVNKISFVSTRVFVTTDNNGPYANSLSELETLPNALVLSDYVFNVPEDANTNFVSVTSNVPWTVSSDQPWLTANVASGIRNENFGIEAAENTGLPRTGVITLSSDSLSQVVTITVNQDGATGITENTKLSAQVKVLPNPNNGSFTLDFSTMNAVVNRVSVFDVNGRLLSQSEVFSPSLMLPFTVQFPSGNYFIRLDTDKGSAFQKLIVY